MKASVKLYPQDGVNKENEYSIKVIVTNKGNIKRKTLAKSINGPLEYRKRI